MVSLSSGAVLSIPRGQAFQFLEIDALIKNCLRHRRDAYPTLVDFHTGKKLYHPVKCAADAKLGALARGMAQGHNSMETMSTPRQDMLVGALEGFLEDLGQ